MSNGLEIVRAAERDLDAVLAVLNDASEWLVRKGVAGPWIPGSFSREAFAEKIARGEVYVARLARNTVGAVRLRWRDELFSPTAPSEAGYVPTLWLGPASLRPGCG